MKRIYLIALICIGMTLTSCGTPFAAVVDSLLYQAKRNGIRLAAVPATDTAAAWEFGTRTEPWFRSEPSGPLRHTDLYGFHLDAYWVDYGDSTRTDSSAVRRGVTGP